MPIAGYRGGTGVIHRLRGADGEEFILVYNDTGGTLANGTVKILDWTDDADSKGYYPTPGAPATNNAALQEVGVINDAEGLTEGIADQEWGWLQIKGYCATITTAGTVTDEQYLEVLNGGVAATDDGSTLTTKSFAIAKSGCTGAGTVAGVLLGYRVVVAAT